MAFKNWLVDIEKKYALGLLGLVITLVLGALGIYVDFLRANAPDVRLEILSEASVLDVREDIGDLVITYKGHDLKARRESLRVFVVRVANRGSAGVTLESYDPRTPLGIEVHDGTLALDTELLDASSAYLRQNVSPRQLTSTQVAISPIILDKNAWFTLRVVVIHANQIAPALVGSGKIAGMQEVNTLSLTEPPPRSSFWEGLLLPDTIWGLLPRFPLYVIVFMLGALLIIAPLVFLGEKLGKRRRSRLVGSYLRSDIPERLPAESSVLRGFISVGEESLRMAHLVLTDKTVLERCRGALEHAPAKDEADFIRRATRDPHLRHMAFPMGSWAARALKEDGVIRQSGNEWHIDESRANAVKVFCAYVRLDFRSDNHDPVAG